MPQQLTIHVGYPKTGTTTLQDACFAKLPEDVFLGKSAGRMTDWVDRFRILINYGSGYHVRESAVYFSDILRKNGEKLVISLEGITNPIVDTHYMQPKDVFLKIEHVRAALEIAIQDGLDVRILITVRHQVSLLPSLFAQVGFHGAAAGLFEFEYDSYLDFLLEDRVTGFGPDFEFDRYAAHCSELFGRDAVTVLSMKDLFGNCSTNARKQLAQIIPMNVEAVSEALDTHPRNVRRSSDSPDYKIMAGSPLARRRLLGIPKIRLADKARIGISRTIFRALPDRSERITAFYSASNDALAKNYGIIL